jgi:AcrR family transcriptional regulator
LTPTTGLRERKKQKTRDAIQREALRLFQAQGYSATTIEQIAAAAEISPSTFFNYFPTKEDVVLYDAYDPMLVASLAVGPPGESLSAAFRRALEGLAVAMERDREMILLRARLWLAEPALRARVWEELERARDLLTAVMAARSGREADDFELRIIAMTLVAAAFESSLEWIRQGGEGNLVTYVSRALDVVDATARLDGL